MLAGLSMDSTGTSKPTRLTGSVASTPVGEVRPDAGPSMDSPCSRTT